MCPSMWKSTATQKHIEGVKEAFFRWWPQKYEKQVYKGEKMWTWEECFRQTADDYFLGKTNKAICCH